MFMRYIAVCVIDSGWRTSRGWQGWQPWGGEMGAGSDGFASGIAAVEFVPVFDVGFTSFPTEKDLAVAEEGREIDEAAVGIFELDLAGGELLEDGLDGGDKFDPAVGDRAADILAGGEERGQLLVDLVETGPVMVELIEPLADLREQRAGFGASVMFRELMRHGLYSGRQGGCARASSLRRTSSSSWSSRDRRQASMAWLRLPSSAWTSPR
jgi:hypothetical protein